MQYDDNCRLSVLIYLGRTGSGTPVLAAMAEVQLVISRVVSRPQVCGNRPKRMWFSVIEEQYIGDRGCWLSPVDVTRCPLTPHFKLEGWFTTTATSGSGSDLMNVLICYTTLDFVDYFTNTSFIRVFFLSLIVAYVFVCMLMLMLMSWFVFARPK